MRNGILNKATRSDGMERVGECGEVQRDATKWAFGDNRIMVVESSGVE